MASLVLLRHGQSLWNQEGRFTGWADIDLSEKGRSEAREAGRLLCSSGFVFDKAYTSVLKRAIRTLWIVLDEMNLMWIPINTCWRLNERFYGDLQGKSKREMEEKYGIEQVSRWRRSVRARPPALPTNDKRSPRYDPKYRNLGLDRIPLTESLQDTRDRMLPCWQSWIKPQLEKGKNVLVVTHGNTIRAQVMHLEGISEQEIELVEMPTGIPLVYELDENLRPKARYYLD
jgi:2,3-bisphosphoglycerate-dependent phosphoglycerate mutase